MDGEVRFYVRDMIRRLCEWKHLTVIQGNVQKDHVHLVEIPPNQSASFVAGFLKGRSAIKIFDRHKDLRKKYWGMHFWSTGYFVSTVGVNEEQVVKYIRRQQKRTANRTARKICSASFDLDSSLLWDLGACSRHPF